MLMRWLTPGSSYIALRWRLLTKKTKAWLGWTFCITSCPQEIVLITKGQRFNQSCPHNGTPIKTLNNRAWRASRVVNTSKYQECGTGQTRKGQKLLCSRLPDLALCSSSTGLFQGSIIYNKPVLVNKVFSLNPASHSSKLLNPRRGLWSPQFVAKSGRSCR